MTDAELDFSAAFDLTVSAAQPDARPIAAFVLSFDVCFAGGVSAGGARKPVAPVTLSTAPRAEPTHWKQAVLWIRPEHRRAAKTGEQVRASNRVLDAAPAA